MNWNTKEVILEGIKGNTFPLRQSRLKHLLGDYPERFAEPWDDTPSEAMILGLMTECLLLEPEEMDKRFQVASKIWDKTTKGYQLIESLFEKQKIVSTDPMELHMPIILEIADEIDYYKNIKDDGKRMDRIKSTTEDLYNELRDKDPDKYFCTPDLFKEAQEIAMILDTHPRTSRLFERTPDQDFVIQHEMSWEIDGIPCEGRTDITLINHKDKSIRVLDLKTGGMGLYSAARKFRWDIQGAWYTYGLTYNKPEGCNGYEVKLPIYVYMKRGQGTPLVKHFSEKDMMTGAYGGSSYKTVGYGGNQPLRWGKKFDGFHDLVERYKLYQALGSFELTPEEQDEEFVDYLNLF